MSSVFDKNIPFFNHPKDWIDWSHEFRTKARALKLWDYIDPETLKPWATEPTAPDFADYPKKLTRLETRASSSTAQTPSHTMEEIDTRNPPTSVAEMTAEGRASYQLDWSAYVFQTKEYERHSTNLEKLISWVFSTTSKTLLKTCCREGETLDEWYQAFKKVGSAYEDNRIPDARARYQRAIKPLSKLPKNFDDWLAEWENAIAEGQELKIGDIQTAQYWAPDLTKALRNVLPMWATSFDLINKKVIKDDSIDFREVTADLRRQWTTLQPKSLIAKGAFPSYGQASGLEPLDTAESDEDKPQRKRGGANKGKGKGKRKRADTSPIGAALTSGGSCEACLGLHGLKDCYYIFKDRAPEGWKLNPGIKRLVEDRIKTDNSLAEQIKRLRKGKDAGTDDS